MSSGIELSFVIGRAADAAAGGPRGGAGDVFRVVVVGDLSGRDSRREAGADGPTFMPQRIDLDSFDRVFARMAPCVRVVLPATGGADEPVLVALERFEDLEPDRLLLGQPVFARLRDLRARLADPSTFAQAASALRAAEASQAPDAEPAAVEDDAATLERLLGGPAGAAAGAAPASPGRAPEAGVATAVDRLARAAVAGHVVPDTPAAQRAMVEALDRTIGSTLRTLLRDPHWRTLEGGWHAIDRFVHGVEMDAGVRLELVDASAVELLESLVAAEGDPQRMPLASTLRDGQRERGDPACTLIVALHSFGSGAAELALLAALGSIAAQQGAVLLAGAEASLALLDVPAAPQDAAAVPGDAEARSRWQTMRRSALAAHVGLVWPRLLTRLPYGPGSHPVQAFAFDELADKPGHEGLPWRAAALDLAALLASAFVDAGWDLEPSAAVEIDDLPGHVDRGGEEPRLQAVAELYLSEREARAVAAGGVMPLVSDRSQPRARLALWRSIGLEHAALAGRWKPG